MSPLQITFNDGHWSATSERWALNAQNNKFRSLERLLAELASMGIRSLGGLSWEGLPAADEFNMYALSADINTYLLTSENDYLSECANKGCWLISAAKYEDDEWIFYINCSANSAWHESQLKHLKEQCGYRWVVTSRDPGCEGVQDHKAYLRPRLLALTDQVQALIAAG